MFLGSILEPFVQLTAIKDGINGIVSSNFYIWMLFLTEKNIVKKTYTIL